MNHHELERRAARWRQHLALRDALLALGVALLTAAPLIRFVPAAAAVVALAGAGVTWMGRRRRTPRISAATIAAHLNRACPALEESAGLWLRDPAALTLVERLQLRRLNCAWDALPDRATLGFPRADALRPAIGLAGIAALALLAALAWPHTPSAPPLLTQPVVAGKPAPQEPALKSAALLVQPPAYLEKPHRRIKGLDAVVEEGASVTWELTLTGSVTGVTLDNAGPGEPIAAEAVNGGVFRARAVIGSTRLYQLTVTAADGKRRTLPQVYTLKVQRDEPPRLTWLEPATSRTIVDEASVRSVSVKVSVTDDHALASVHLVATVAKGSGEGVKFREQKLTLEREGHGDIHANTFDLHALGLEPGDELYFYAEATDHRTPRPNVTRSETRFVILRGPTSPLAVPGTALAALKVLPQYFRSQRQLIMDTERLLEEQPRLPADRFRERSEEIGVDQKLLRLRYGQFLGEELETDASDAPKEAQAMAFAARLRGGDKQGSQRAAAIERTIELQHQHEQPAAREGRPLTFEEIRAPHVHNHDNAEVATLFEAQVKGALRAVLAAMWEAEAFLRTAQPAQALPAENRALELLKELQQADRVYVQRVGFEPPPLKIDERRLRGEPGGLLKVAHTTIAFPPPDADVLAVQQAAALLARGALASLPAETATRIETRLVAAAQENPESYVRAVEVWRRRAHTPSPAEWATLNQALWTLLPEARPAPHASSEPNTAVSRRYFDHLAAEGERMR